LFGIDLVHSPSSVSVISLKGNRRISLTRLLVSAF
jgi:hypothetical protein